MNFPERRRRLPLARLLLSLLCVTLFSLLSDPAVAQSPDSSDGSGDSPPKPADLFRTGGGMIQAAADLRKAGESFERFGKSLELTVGTLAKGLTDSSENLAKFTSGFDPLGLREAFLTIQQQNQTIQELHDAEIKRLTRENAALKKELKRMGKKRKKRN